MKKETAKATIATVPMIRASSLPPKRAKMGVSSTATTPLGAATSPAQVAM